MSGNSSSVEGSFVRQGFHGTGGAQREVGAVGSLRGGCGQAQVFLETRQRLGEHRQERPGKVQVVLPGVFLDHGDRLPGEFYLDGFAVLAQAFQAHRVTRRSRRNLALRRFCFLNRDGIHFLERLVGNDFPDVQARLRVQPHLAVFGEPFQRVSVEGARLTQVARGPILSIVVGEGGFQPVLHGGAQEHGGLDLPATAERIE